MTKILASCSLIFLLGSIIIYKLINIPIHEDFDQKWKYRIMHLGSDIAYYFARFLELSINFHRINATRLAYHINLGLLTIRNDEDNIKILDEFIDDILIRIYKPSIKSKKLDNQSNLWPTVIFLHGGGFLFGSADICEPISYLISKQTNTIVIYIEYRLIPEYKHPAAYLDSSKVIKYLIKHNKKYSIDLENFIIMGDSAGGNLATTITQNLIENKLATPKLQILVYPMLQFFDFTLPSYRINMKKRVLGVIDKENFKHFLEHFTGYEIDDTIFLNGHTSSENKIKYSQYINYEKNDLTNQLNSTIKYSTELSEILLSKEVSPLLVDNQYLSNHTPNYTFLITTEMDILKDEGFIYANRLKKLGKNIFHKHYENLFHGVMSLTHGPLEFQYSRQLINDISNYINSLIYLDK